jgi:hypothetical protein
VTALMVVAAVLIGHQDQAAREYAASAQKYEESKRIVTAEAAISRPYTGDKSYREEWRAERQLEAERWTAESNYWSAVATCIGIFFLAATLWQTIAATRAAGDAANAAERAIAVAQENANRELRAYIFAKPTNVSLNNGRLESVTLSVRNHGATPAANIGMRGTVAIRPWPLPDDMVFEFPEVNETTQNLAPQTEYPALINVNLPLTEEAADQLAAGTHRLYALATIAYLDAFGEGRSSRLCSAMDGPTFIRAFIKSKTGDAGTIQHDTAWNFSHRYNDWT